MYLKPGSPCIDSPLLVLNLFDLLQFQMISLMILPRSDWDFLPEWLFWHKCVSILLCYQSSWWDDVRHRHHFRFRFRQLWWCFCFLMIIDLSLFLLFLELLLEHDLGDHKFACGFFMYTFRQHPLSVLSLIILLQLRVLAIGIAITPIISLIALPL